MSKFKRLTNLFNNNRFILFFSLALSIVIWFTVSIVYSPQTGRTITQVPVNVIFADQEVGYKIYSDTELVAAVTVDGKKYEVDQLNADSLVVEAQVTAVKSGGMYELNLTARKKDTAGEFNVTTISPATINVMIDVERNTKFDVDVKCVGATIATLEQETENLVLVPSFSDPQNAVVSVNGPDSEVRQIARIEAVADVNPELSDTRRFASRIVAYDEDGVVIYDADSRLSKLHYTSFSYESAEIIAAVNMRKTVPVTYNVVGGATKQPPITLHQVVDNETVNNTNVNTVSIQGEVDLIKEMTEVVLDGTVDLSKIQWGDEETYRFDLQLPRMDGITYNEFENLAELSQTGFLATVNLDGYARQTIGVDTAQVKVQNVADGHQAKLNQGNLLITVIGPRSAVSRLEAEDIELQINAAGVGAGTTTLVPTVTVKNEPSCWVIGSYSVSLDVLK